MVNPQFVNVENLNTKVLSKICIQALERALFTHQPPSLPPSLPPSAPPLQIMGVFSCRGGHRVLAASPEEAALFRRGRALRTHSTSGRKRSPAQTPRSTSQGVRGRKPALRLSFSAPDYPRCAGIHFRHCVTELSTGALAPCHHYVQAGAAAPRCGGPPTCSPFTGWHCTPWARAGTTWLSRG